MIAKALRKNRSATLGVAIVGALVLFAVLGSDALEPRPLRERLRPRDLARQASGRPERHVLARDRSALPRRARPARGRRAPLALHRDRRDRHRHGHRRRGRDRRRMVRGADARRRAHAHRRHRPRLPVPAPRHGARGRARSHDADDHPAHPRPHGLARNCANRQGEDDAAPQPRLRHGIARARPEHAGDHAPPRAAERRRAAARRRDGLGRADDPRRERSLVPRWRNRPADPDLGPHALRRAGLLHRRRRGSRSRPVSRSWRACSASTCSGRACAMRSIRASSERARVRACVLAGGARARGRVGRLLERAPRPHPERPFATRSGERPAPPRRDAHDRELRRHPHARSRQRRRRPRPADPPVDVRGSHRLRRARERSYPTSPTTGRSRRTVRPSASSSARGCASTTARRSRPTT